MAGALYGPHIAEVMGDRVLPHDYWTVADGIATPRAFPSEALQQIECPGGIINEERDRAP